LAARPRPTWHDRTCWLLLSLAFGLLLLPRPLRVRLSLPLQTGLLAPLRATAWFRHNLADLTAENRRLTRLASELAVENARLIARGGRSRAQVPPTNLLLVYCPIIGRDMSTLERFLVVSRGTRHGVVAGTCAITAEGVVGRVIAAGPDQALVQTLLDPDSRIAVTNLRSRALAVARPEGRGLTLDYVPDAAGAAPGDTLVTSGLGLVFPKGLRVGTITAVSAPQSGIFRRIEITPFVQVMRIEGVFALVRPGPASEANDWLENLAPAQVEMPLPPVP